MPIKGLEPFENNFYIMLEQDLTSRNGFRYEGLGRWTMAPDWDPNPQIECGHGLHIVQGHPLYCHNFVSRKNPSYFEVKTLPDPPVKSPVDKKFRAKGVFLIREITDFDPEFDSNILAYLAKNDIDWVVRQAAVNKLDASAHSALLAYLAKNDINCVVRQTAVKKLDASAHSALLAYLAKNASDLVVRQAAVKKLDASAHSQPFWLIWLRTLVTGMSAGWRKKEF